MKIESWANGAASAALLFAVLAHIASAPFTKVEESFNLQAIHDMLFHGFNTDAYDHHEFPGVVPRSFLGAAGISTLASAIVYPLQALHLPKVSALISVRATVGIMAWLCMLRMSSAVQRTFGSSCSVFFLLITASQFHLPFYMSRTLPNTLALCLVTIAGAHWIDGSELWLVPALLSATSVIFRCDMILLTGTVCLHLLLTRRMRFVYLLASGIWAGLIALVTTVIFDSVLWQRWLWPEGEVLWFNTVLNRSSEWGVAPWHWYFTSALPKALLVALPLSCAGVVLERRLRSYALAIGTFVILYSFLAHKEVRFLFPVLPFFNVAAACATARAWAGGKKNRFRRLLASGVTIGILVSSFAAAIFSWASHHNYPGAAAVMIVNQLYHRGALHECSHRQCSVHICPFAAMTGVSRFLEHPGLMYSKAEAPADEIEHQGYDILIATTNSIPGYTLLDTVQGFRRIALATRASDGMPWPFHIVTQPDLFVLQKQL